MCESEEQSKWLFLNNKCFREMKELIWLQLVFLSRLVSFLTQSIFCSFLVSWWLSWFISSLLTDPDLFVSEAQITGNETVTCVCFVRIDRGILSCCRTQSLNTTLVVLQRIRHFSQLGRLRGEQNIQLQINRSKIYLRLSLQSELIYFNICTDWL